RATLLAKRSLDDSSATLAFTVAAVLAPDAPENDFNLTPNPAAPLNVFVPLKTLSDLAQNEAGESKSLPPKPTPLFASGGSVDEFNAALRQRVTLEDYGLKVRVPRQRKAYVSVETDQLLMDERTATAVQTAADKLTPKLRAERTMVYLVNSIS